VSDGGDDALVPIPRCALCGAAAGEACPRCRRALCDAHMPDPDSRCASCEEAYAEQLRQSSGSRAIGTAVGVLAGSFVTGVGMMVLYMLLSLLFGLGPTYIWFPILLLTEMGGAYGGAVYTHRALEARQRDRFLADGATPLPEARVL
jgi:uncharacterized protein (DUF983 family)